MTVPEVLITCPLDTELLAPLSNSANFRYPETANSQQPLHEQIPHELGNADIIIAELDTVDAETIKSSPHLKLVISCRASPVNVDLEACSKAGIPVCTTPGRNADSTADLTFGLILDTTRHITESSMWMRAGNWNDASGPRPYHQFKGPTLNKRTLGVIGGGAVGQRVARRGLGFGMSVVIYDPFLTPEDLPQGCELATLDELLHASDVVTVHVPLTEETIGLIDKSAFAKMKRGSFLINAARAAIIDQDDMLESLQNGHLAGVGLDVYTEEPPPTDSLLFRDPRVVMTPHIAGASSDVVTSQTSMVTEILSAYLSGTALPYPARQDLIDFRKIQPTPTS